MLSSIESATYRAIFPDWQWHLIGNQLSAFQADLLNLLWWAKTEDGQKDRNRPAPVSRPGVPGYQRDAEAEFAAMDIDALEATLALPRVSIENPL
ncbi:DUF5361 domain-containing protein [Actinomycetaceae bacterium MB13-C1-2]|nr:DUF5361 domain-containing protein [Actinomycetaceae bacterium MB13-C1-2]